MERCIGKSRVKLLSVVLTLSVCMSAFSVTIFGEENTSLENPTIHINDNEDTDTKAGNERGIASSTITPMSIKDFIITSSSGYVYLSDDNRYVICDMASALNIVYNNSEFMDGIVYEIFKAVKNESGNYVTTGSSLLNGKFDTNSGVLTFPEQLSEDGLYFMKLEALNTGWGMSDSGSVIINVLHVQATASVSETSTGFNPSELRVGSNKENASLVWKIMKNGVEVASSKEYASPNDIDFRELGDGEYTLINEATVISEFNHEAVDDANVTFKFRYPETTAKCDKKYNPSKISGTKKIIDSSLAWVIKEKSGKEIHGNGETVDAAIINALSEGEYTVTFTETSPEGITHSSEVTFTIRHPQPTIMIDRDYNPISIVGGMKISGSTLTWNILGDGENGTEINGLGDTIPSNTIKELPEGEYTVTFIEKSPENETKLIKGTFTIRHPHSETIIDRTINPKVIKGTKKIVDSVLTWKIKHGDIVILEGQGNTIPQNTFHTLSDGSYVVEFTERSPEDEWHTSSGGFTIRHPKSTTSVDRLYNPNKIVGTKLIPESELTWAILNNKGVEIKSGMGNEIPNIIITNLMEGNYIVKFTETSPEMDTHTSSANFTIRHPKSTTTVDKLVNPSHITGTKKISDSVLIWQVKDKNGKVIGNGIGNTVPEETINRIENGTYIVEFIETSPEGETYTSSSLFIIYKEKPVDKPNTSVTKKKPKIILEAGLVNTSDTLYNTMLIYILTSSLCFCIIHVLNKKTSIQ